MYRFAQILTIAIVATSSGMAFSQGNQNLIQETARELNRVSSLLNVANSMMATSTKLKATPQQIEELKALRKQFDGFRRKFKSQTGPLNESRIKLLRELLVSIKEVEKKFKEDVLLPFQLEEFKKVAFERLLKRFGNSYTLLINTYMLDSLKLSDRQKEDFDELLKTTSEKKKVITAECKKELAKIETEAQIELSKIFTPEQIKLFEKLAGKKLGEPDDDIRHRYLHGKSDEPAKGRKDKNGDRKK